MHASARRRPVAASLAGCRLRALALGGLLVVASTSVLASTVRVGAGTTLRSDTAALDFGCGTLAVEGSVAIGSVSTARLGSLVVEPGGSLSAASAATLEVGGDWTNLGSASLGTSLVRFSELCGTAAWTISGDTTFHDLYVETVSGGTLTFESGSTQTTGGLLQLRGGSLSTRLAIRSSVPGSEAFLDAQGADSVAWVDLQDNHLVGNAIALDGSSIDSGNTTGWIFTGASVPALGAFAHAAAALALAAAAAGALHSRRSGPRGRVWGRRPVARSGG